MPRTALMVIDMLNHYEHEDAEPLAASVREQLPQIEGLVDRAGPETLLVYVNDNHDAWEAGREQLVRRALAGRHPELVEPIAPGADTPFLSRAATRSSTRRPWGTCSARAACSGWCCAVR